MESPLITVLIPVLNRPHRAAIVSSSLREAASVPIRTIFICSLGDDVEIEACRETRDEHMVVSWEAGSGDYARKTNAAYKHVESEFVFTAADDVEFTPGWDTEILAVANKTGAGVVGSNDDANPTVKRGHHSTHTLFRREYVDTVGATFFDGPGVVYHEGYEHQWVDTEAVRAAMDRGQWAFARRSVVRHHHPFFDKTVGMDDTYRKALGDASHDSALYRQRLQEWTRQRRQR